MSEGSPPLELTSPSAQRAIDPLRPSEPNGSDSKIVHIPYEEAYEEGFEDMERQVPDTTRIRNLTGWEPTRTLNDILDGVIRVRAQNS